MNESQVDQSTDKQPVPQELRLARRRATSGISRRIMLGATLGLFILAIFSWMRSQGNTLRIQSNAIGAQVSMDGSFDGQVSAGGLTVNHLPAGTRQIELSHRDYTRISRPVEIGWFSSGTFDAQMTPIPVALRVTTEPGAEVLLDSVKLGVADSQGVFTKADVIPKTYELLVRLKGRNDWRRSDEMHPPRHDVFARLLLSAESIRQGEENVRQAEANRAKVLQHIGEARQLFGARNYRGALAALDAALILDPQNSEAKSLRAQVDQTMKILGGR